MKAKFVRFDILDALSLPEYGRWIRLANKHREWFDNMQLLEYLIDNNGAYLINDHPVIERNGSAAHTPDEEAATPIDEAHDASGEEHEPLKVSNSALILFGLACSCLTIFLMDGVSLGLPRWLYLVGAVAFVVAAEVFNSQEGVPAMTKLEMFADVFIVSLVFVGLIVAIIWLLLRVVG